MNGEAVDLNAPPPSGGGRGARRQRAAELSRRGLDQTLARIALAAPIPAKSTAKLDIAWRTKLPGGPTGAAIA